MAKFRFQDLEIWKDAISIAKKLFERADGLEKKKLFKFSEQIRAAALSISNNIAEGSGSESNREFANFLNIAKRSAFENANMAIFLNSLKFLEDDVLEDILGELDHLCARITKFRRTLLQR